MKKHFHVGTKINKLKQVRFSVWAPYAKEVYVEIRSPKNPVFFDAPELKDRWAKEWHMEAEPDDEKSKFMKLHKDENDVFSGLASPNIAKEGDLYRFILVKHDGEEVYRKDPRSACQPHIYSWSKIYNQNRYKWSKNEKEWQSGHIKEKLSVKNKNLLQMNELVYLEVHLPTATDNGDITSFKKCIDDIAEQGFTGILLMPMEGTYGVNWGYDGVDKYAVTRCWGLNLLDEVSDIDKVNDELKSLVDYCHQKKLNVGIDWVPSHITEEFGNVLLDFGPYENVNRYENYVAKDWGGFTFNLEGEKVNGCPVRQPDNNVKQVRSYIVDIPLYLVKNYHFDFIRGDQSPNMCSNITMKIVKAEMDFHFPDVAVIWEDHRKSENLCEPLSKIEINNSNEINHEKSVMALLNNDTGVKNIGADELWDFDFSHSLEANILEKEIWPCAPNVEHLGYLFENSEKGTTYLLSHDEIGNHGGSRLMVKYILHKSCLANHVETQKHKEKRAANAVRKFIELYLYDNLIDLSLSAHVNSVLEFYGVKKNSLTPDKLKKLINEAFSYHKVGAACVYLARGSKMIFQGDNYGEINPFYFHREQPVNEALISFQKGYDISKKGFWASKLTPEKHCSKGIYELFKDLNNLLKTNLALKKGTIKKIYSDNCKRVLIIERAYENEKVLAFVNFSQVSQSISFCSPDSGRARYKLILDTNNVKYQGIEMEENTLITCDSNRRINVVLQPISFQFYSLVE